jgi:hypothetical protein
MRRVHIADVPASDLLHLESLAVDSAREVARLLLQFFAVVRLFDRGYGFVGEGEGVLGRNGRNGWGGRGLLVLGLARGGGGAGGLEAFLGGVSILLSCWMCCVGYRRTSNGTDR